MNGRKHTGPVVFLGPQRHAPTLRAVLSEYVADDARPAALLSAGWEELESEDTELREHLGGAVHNLGLHGRALAAFEQDPTLLEGLQTMHDELSELQRLYRGQLRHLLAATQELLKREATPSLREEHCSVAIENLRNLDQRHLSLVARVRARFKEELGLVERASLAPHREELRARLAEVRALCVAGGHVGVLYNRCWLFDLLGLLPQELPIFAWSGGAMVLSEQVVLFHDDPPEGKGGAEVLGPGLGLVPAVRVFPHARHRLRLDDRVRVQILARRFGPATCLAFDGGARLDWDGAAWRARDQAQTLHSDGRVTEEC